MVKKMVAPIICALVLLFFILLYGGALLFVSDKIFQSALAKIVVSVITLFGVGAIITVLVQTIKEIREDEDDDLSKY